jgi:hypothetical protein
MLLTLVPNPDCKLLTDDEMKAEPERADSSNVYYITNICKNQPFNAFAFINTQKSTLTDFQ